MTAERCSALLPIGEDGVRCGLDAAHEGVHRLQQAGYTFSWHPMMSDYIQWPTDG